MYYFNKYLEQHTGLTGYEFIYGVVAYSAVTFAIMAVVQITIGGVV
jgi:hypothetical protein